MTEAELAELDIILSRGHISGGRFIPQPGDAARYHELVEAKANEFLERAKHARPRPE